MKKNIVWFDLETTGISTTADRIIEICMIKTDFDGNEVLYGKPGFNNPSLILRNKNII